METLFQVIIRMYRLMPVPIKQILNTIRSRWAVCDRGSGEPSLLDQFPWMSPNVWEMIVAHYRSQKTPAIFEYGTGASSLWHISTLLVQGGKYVGVEHDTAWFSRVIGAVLELGIKQQLDLMYEGEPLGGGGYDAHFVLRGSQKVECVVTLKLRPPTRSGETQERFAEYVQALTEPCDVIIVDGRARRECVNYVLNNYFIKPGGLLVLMEAGRGQEGWLGYPALKGESDYQPEVNRMLALGGKMVDGNGLARWGAIKQKGLPSSVSYEFPCEACFLYLSDGFAQ